MSEDYKVGDLYYTNKFDIIFYKITRLTKTMYILKPYEFASKCTYGEETRIRKGGHMEVGRSGWGNSYFHKVNEKILEQYHLQEIRKKIKSQLEFVFKQVKNISNIERLEKISKSLENL